MPKRIQMTRHKPWRADNPDAVIVARSGRWGNPYTVVEFGSAEAVVERYRQALRDGCLPPVGRYAPVTVADIRTELAGMDVACWCQLDAVCHGDVILRVAAGGEP